MSSDEAGVALFRVAVALVVLVLVAVLVMVVDEIKVE